MYQFTFEVRGGTAFPVDMLRYDSAFPNQESGSSDIEASMRYEADGTTTVQLRTNQADRHWRPTEGRWKSFGWEVVPDSLEVS